MEQDWISITEAAERLSKAGDVVTRSTLSRYLRKHSEALETRKIGREVQVDYIRLLAHRAENIRIEKSAGATRAAPVQSERDVSKSAPLPGTEKTQVNGAARKALADAELRELDLAERRAELTPTREVDKAARDAVALMNSAYERAVESEAATLSVKYGWDERMVRLALKKFARVGLDTFHREVLKTLDDFRRVANAPMIEGEDAAGISGDMLQ